MSGYSNPACTLPGILQYPIGNLESVQSRGSVFPYDPDPGSRNLPTMVGIFPGSHALPNGNFSASPFPAGKVTLELPSLQLQVLDSGGPSGFPTLLPETCISSPTITDSLQSECVSIRDSGLLDAIIHEAHVLGNLRDELPTWSSGSSIAISGVVESSAPHDAEFDACDSISPIGCSAASVFSECTLKSGCSLEETPHDGINGQMKCQQEESSLIPRTGSKRPHSVTYRPDELLAASCSNEVSIYEEYVNDHESLQSAPSTLSTEEYALDSYCWDERLSIYQNPEFHGD